MIKKITTEYLLELKMDKKQYEEIQGELYIAALEMLRARAKQSRVEWFSQPREIWQQWLEYTGLHLLFREYEVYDQIASRAIALSV